MKKNMIKENLNNFYSAQDSNGKIGQVGQVKSYDCGYMTESNVEIEAKESGYQSIEEYLKTWWNEVSEETPFTWETLGNGYGYHGNDIFTQVEPDGGILHCKEIFGQIMFDVYPPQQNESKTNKNMKKNTVKINENTLRQIVAESVKKVLKEGDSFNFYKDKEDRSGELRKKILFLRSYAIQLYEFIQKGNGIWGYRVGDSEEIQQERLELAHDIVRAINRLYKSVDEADFNDAEGWHRFGV